MKIIAYTLVRSPEAISLAAYISQAIIDGWQPYGTLVIDQKTGACLQPMVKYSWEEKP